MSYDKLDICPWCDEEVIGSFIGVFCLRLIIDGQTMSIHNECAGQAVAYALKKRKEEVEGERQIV